MLASEQFMDILDLHRQGLSLRAIAQQTGHSRNTIRKVLRGQHAPTRKPSLRTSCLDPYKDYLTQRLTQVPLSAVRLHAEITAMGYTGSVQTLRRFRAHQLGQARAHAATTVRFETPPGEQAQADWAHAGHVPDEQGQLRPVYAFTIVLAFSRMLYVHFLRAMHVADLVTGHRQAFTYFGGWPRTILYDNMKQVRIAPGKFNDTFLDFAHHYGFTPKTHRPYRPRTKGKVERMVDYLKDNFLLGRSFMDLADLNTHGRAWLDGTANARVHATTGKRPMDLLTQEGLTPLASVPDYQFLDPVRRIVSAESLVHFHGSRYSVPPAYVRQTVEVAASGGRLRVRVGDTIIAEHAVAAQAGQCIVEKSHVEELWKVTHEQTQRPPARLTPPPLPDVQQRDLSCFAEVVS